LITYFQAVLIGLFQGVTELVPISSLGHSVLLPELLGWHDLVEVQTAHESFYLAFLVALHVATALALLVHYRETWVRIVGGFVSSIAKRRIDTPDERLAWLLVVGTIPVGVVALVFERLLRSVFAKPAAAAAFLVVNGVILLVGERLRRRSMATTAPAGGPGPGGSRLDRLELREAGVIGVAQSLALFAGISRSGVTMVGGLLRGLDHEDAAHFSFLLATPVIFGAGVYKIPELLGPVGDGVRGQALVGGIAAFFAAYAAVRFLERWFERRNLVPFAVYCFAAGGLSLLYLAR
jgi:undecaprenyl-diphosphatase